jgi:small subunit ribosomal protein S3
LGHKVNPNGFRLGVIKGWESRWYANRNYSDLVLEDDKLRKLIMKRLANASVSRIEIERVASTQISIAIHTAKPGIVIGKSGESVERLRQALEAMTKKDDVAKKVRLSILEIRNPEVDAVLVAHGIAEQIEKRVSFRRAMKQAVQKAMRGGAKGIKVIVGGRLGGAEIARTEKEVEGSVPLQTLRANIDYGIAEAHTTFGVIGIKVWIYHGDILPERQRAEGFRATETNLVPAGERGSHPAGDRAGRSPRGERGPRPSGTGERRSRPAGTGGERGPRPSGTGERRSRPAGTGSGRGPRPPAGTPTATPPETTATEPAAPPSPEGGSAD